jgi:hypothetical protein
LLNWFGSLLPASATEQKKVLDSKLACVKSTFKAQAIVTAPYNISKAAKLRATAHKSKSKPRNASQIAKSS